MGASFSSRVPNQRPRKEKGGPGAQARPHSRLHPRPRGQTGPEEDILGSETTKPPEGKALPLLPFPGSGTKLRGSETPLLGIQLWPAALGHSPSALPTHQGCSRSWETRGDGLVEMKASGRPQNVSLHNSPSAAPGRGSCRPTRSRPWRSRCLTSGHPHCLARIGPKVSGCLVEMASPNPVTPISPAAAPPKAGTARAPAERPDPLGEQAVGMGSSWSTSLALAAFFLPAQK